ncbi:MAG: MFS transporter [Clostridiales bacterium]|nr:MFS transporter [Roseburia sp.]MDD7636436.1 MFS transporter [Clostridiales bacterium]
MEKTKKKQFWVALIIFGLTGQIAWAVENMYLNVFIYKMFHASAGEISLMVGASAATATLTTVLMGALSDYVGKRKLFICGGYILWGISILAFALIRVDVLTMIAGNTVAAATLGVSCVIILDCVMTFFGSAANDAAFHAWMTDWGDENTRGRIEGIHVMMPLVAILVVFGVFLSFDLEQSSSWTAIFLIIGGAVLAIGILGLFLIVDKPEIAHTYGEYHYLEMVCYSFRPRALAENKLLYAVIGAFAVFNISIQIYMPYLILYYEKGIGMTNYVLILAPAIVIATVITAFYGRLFDMLGFKSSVMPTVLILMAGYVLLYFGRKTGVVFIGSLLMMAGYLTGMAVFGAMIRNHIPEQKAGQFQGIRMIGQVLIPGIIGPAIGAAVLSDAEVVLNNDGTTSFLPDECIFLAAFLAALCLLFILAAIFHMMRHGHYRLISEAGERVLAGEECWKDYPRPQLKRQNWVNLNDGWKLNGNDIRMPFPPQSLLSGYGKRVGKYLEYTCEFKSKPQENKRTILHFGAVDQVAEIFLNGTCLGKHEGGYLPFSFDITPLVQRENHLVVKVTDKLSHRYPYGKQRRNRGGMWYTPVSGIWQTVWYEEVPETYINNLRITPDETRVRIEIEMCGAEDRELGENTESGVRRESSTCTENDKSVAGKVSVRLHDGTVYEQTFDNGKTVIDFKQIRTAEGEAYVLRKWSPEDPYLYRATITVGEDFVETYFALREIAVHKINEVNRVCLNGEPIFLNGVLDQGYFCDGIYLPAKEKEYERDILRMKELGINMLRKHIKIEPECFYYYCDLHGMLVMQDMVNNGSYSFIRDTALPTIGMQKRDDTKHYVRGEVKEIFEKHMVETQKHLYNHPCIIAYTIFNEGWGQFESDRMYEWAKQTDATRLYDATSGWFAQTKSDFDSYHVYFGDNKPIPDERPMLLSEFGGYSYMVPGHIYGKYNSYGYGVCKDSKELTDCIEVRYEELIYPIIASGACGCVYTQVSDVEDEINGFYTYDRKVCKVDVARMRGIANKINAQMKEVGER